jgi:hypothetical protein
MAQADSVQCNLLKIIVYMIFLGAEDLSTNKAQARSFILADDEQIERIFSLWNELKAFGCMIDFDLRAWIIDQGIKDDNPFNLSAIDAARLEGVLRKTSSAIHDHDY